VVNRSTCEIIGHVANLSTEGIMLITSDSMVHDTVLKLSIALPEKIFDRDRIECEAKCMWCKVSPNSDFFEAGLQLCEVSEQEIKAIVGLIAKYRFLD
jgi:hypothetical protein